MFHDDDDKKVSGENMKEGLGINNLLCDIVKVHFLHHPPMPVPFGNISFLAKLVALQCRVYTSNFQTSNASSIASTLASFLPPTVTYCREVNFPKSLAWVFFWCLFMCKIYL